jgi:hypothetical protein
MVEIDKSSVKAIILIAILVLGLSNCFSYFKGATNMEREMNYEMQSSKEKAYQEGQLDAFQGKQMYESATFEDGTQVVMVKDDYLN